ncbi:hypothetical protein [Methanocaldococcus sp.]
MKILRILIILFLLSYVSAFYYDKIIINENNPEKEINFNFSKVDNYKYNLTFFHYGNIKRDMKVEIYLNNKLIYIIDKSAFPGDKKFVSLDITDYLKDGRNVLKVKGVNFNNSPNYSPYYALDNIYINHPSNSPINLSLILILLFLFTLFIFYS